MQYKVKKYLQTRIYIYAYIYAIIKQLLLYVCIYSQVTEFQTVWILFCFAFKKNRRLRTLQKFNLYQIHQTTLK